MSIQIAYTLVQTTCKHQHYSTQGSHADVYILYEQEGVCDEEREREREREGWLAFTGRAATRVGYGVGAEGRGTLLLHTHHRAPLGRQGGPTTH